MIRQKTININNQIISYLSRSQSRSRRLRLTIDSGGQLSVSRPRWLNEKIAEKFIRQKADWIITKLKHINSQPPDILQQGSRQDYLDNKEKARDLVLARLKYFNQFYHFPYQRVSIRNQRSRWGSCSKQGNLNFSYHLIHLPDRLQDYIIVHELCHLKEMNHSVHFWKLVSQRIPDYNQLRKQLRNKLY